MSMENASSSHLSVRVAFVLALMVSSTLTMTYVSGPRENRELAAWSTSLTAWIRIVRRPVNGLRMLGLLRLSSALQSVITKRIDIAHGPHTIRSIGRLNIHMKILVALQSLLQQLDLLVALNATAFGVRATLAVTLILVQANHLLDTGLVLFLHAQLELELGQHELNLRTEIRGVIFDKI